MLLLKVCFIDDFGLLSALLKDSVAEYCGIDTNHGRRYVFCYQKCCDEYDRTTYDVCCT